jgi:hypothetical protein
MGKNDDNDFPMSEPAHSSLLVEDTASLDGENYEYVE